MPEYHYIARDLEPAPTDWPLFAKWVEAWDTSRPVESAKRELTATTAHVRFHVPRRDA